MVSISSELDCSRRFHPEIRAYDKENKRMRRMSVLQVIIIVAFYIVIYNDNNDSDSREACNHSDRGIGDSNFSLV